MLSDHGCGGAANGRLNGPLSSPADAAKGAAIAAAPVASPPSPSPEKWLIALSPNAVRIRALSVSGVSDLPGERKQRRDLRRR